MSKRIITQERLKEILHYCPETGLFTNKIYRGNVTADITVGWHNNKGYIGIKINYIDYLAHRLAFLYMDGELPRGQIDHINHIRDDNRWANIRFANASDNARNRSKNSNNKSGINGVYWNKRIGKWHAQTAINGRKKHLGFFEDIADAAKARQNADIEYGFHTNHGH